MATEPKLRRYIIMPAEGFQDAVLSTASLQPSNAVVAVAARPLAVRTSPRMRVLDSIHENGPKLVEMPAEAELSLRLSTPGLKIVPEVFYKRQWERFKIFKRPEPPRRATRRTRGKAAAAKKAAAKAAATPSFTVMVTDAINGTPVRGAQVVAFTDFETAEGAQGKSGANGKIRLNGISANRKLERVYIYAPAGYWGHFARDKTGSQLANVKLTRIDVADPTLLLTTLYGSLPITSGAGTTIGIIDSGVDGTHPDLPNVSGGLNCVSDETRNNPAALSNWRPALREGEHGTHVAGIAAGRGAGNGFRGVAPGATLRSYRVFPDTGGDASNFDIAKAIDAAISDKCDVINLSLGGGPKDDLTRVAIDRAIAAGAIVVAAAGNEDRDPVSFPAALVQCVAVSAMGRVGTFPKQALGSGDIAPPRGNPNSKNFVAAFSNLGTEIDTTGAGVEIVSTLPGTGHGSMSGTSMAAPAVAGFAAHLLSSNSALAQKIGTDRSRALKDLLYSTCKPQGFGRDFEGFGLPLP